MELATDRIVLRRIAVIDDDLLLRDLLAQLLINRGHTVRAYDSASELVMDLDSFRPHIVIADLQLGEGPTGLDILRLVEDSGHRVLPILLTSFRSTKLVDEAGRLPDRCIHIVKPDISLSKLVEVIENAEVAEVKIETKSVELKVITQDQATLLRMMSEGMSYEQIAEARWTTVRAVHRLTQRLYKALGIDPAQGDPRTLAVAMYNNSKVNVR